MNIKLDLESTIKDDRPQQLIKYYSNILGTKPSTYNIYPTLIIVFDYVTEDKLLNLLQSVANSNRYSLTKTTDSAILSKIYKSRLIMSHVIEFDMDLTNKSGSIIIRS